jgi:hypothetical protein
MILLQQHARPTHAPTLGERTNGAPFGRLRRGSGEFRMRAPASPLPPYPYNDPGEAGMAPPGAYPRLVGEAASDPLAAPAVGRMPWLPRIARHHLTAPQRTDAETSGQACPVAR